MGEAIRINLRLGQKDGDLILLGKQYRISEMVRLAIRYYLGKSNEKIPLPPYVDVPSEAVYTILLYPDSDPEVLEFLQTIPNGYRSTAIKQLLRNAMERCDFRLLQNNEAKKKSEQTKRTSSTQQKASHKSTLPDLSSQPSEPAVRPAPRPMDDEDDIFAGI